MIKDWIRDYVAAQKGAIDSIPQDKVAKVIGLLHTAWKEDRQIFVFGNGGSAANASHFVTDLGKGASDKLGKRFRCLALNDNTSWMTAIANDYSYEDVFLRQLQNFAVSKDVVLALSVSGNSPNVVKAVEWAAANGLHTIALVGRKSSRLSTLAETVMTIDSEHYGRVEDGQMAICHMLCYAFMEQAIA